MLQEGSASLEILDGGTRFVFRLRPEARFHNGRQVTADDVAFSLNRLAGKNSGSEAGFLLDSVVGFERVNLTGESNELEGVRVLDPSTLEIRTSSAWFDFPYVLSHPSTAPIPRQEFEGDPASFGGRPIGSGPYALVSTIEPGKNLSLSAARIGSGRPGIDEVEFVIYDRAESAWADFENGIVDIAESPPSKIDFARATYGDSGGLQVAAGIYLGFNLKNPKLGDVRLRRAISMTIDRDGIAESVYARAVVPARSLVPEGIPGGGSRACGIYCDRDMGGARALVAEAFPDGAPPIVYDYPAGPANDAVAAALTADFAQIGLALEPRPREADVTAYFDLIASSGQELFLLAWPAEYPLADWFLNPLFRSGSLDNHTGYSVPEVDELLARARATPERARRLALYAHIERRLLSDMAVVPVGFFRSRFFASHQVRGFYTDRLGGFEIARLSI